MSSPEIKTVAVLGAGTMGNGIAHVFARAGFNVLLRDVETKFLDRAMGVIDKNLDREVKKGKLAESEKPAVLGRIKPVTDLNALSHADFAVEAVPELRDLKIKVLEQASAALPNPPSSPPIPPPSPSPLSPPKPIAPTASSVCTS